MAAADYEKVTKEDVKRVAAKYFSDKNRTVATLVPEQAQPEPAAAKPEGSNR